jgi:hypothetical protein
MKQNCYSDHNSSDPYILLEIRNSYPVTNLYMQKLHTGVTNNSINQDWSHTNNSINQDVDRCPSISEISMVIPIIAYNCETHRFSAIVFITVNTDPAILNFSQIEHVCS